MKIESALPAVLCAAIGLAVVFGARDSIPRFAAPVGATAEPAETWSDDTTSVPEHVAGAALDGTGFNRLDTDFGHSLAGREWLTQRQAQYGRKLAVKYGRQLDPVLLAIIKVGR